MKRLWFVCFLLLSSAALSAQRISLERIKPSEADPRVHAFNDESVILRPGKMEGAPLMVWLPGTGGKPEYSVRLMQVMADQGYRAIGLEYDDVPAVGQVCPLVRRADCSEKFREMRIWGTGGSIDISNPVEESISARLVALLETLAKRHPKEGWLQYVTPDGKPKWSSIAVAGQSQGAGMAAMIAKKEEVVRAVLFSSPIDSLSGLRDLQLAPWLTWPSATPLDRWYAVRNSREPFNDGLKQSYPALGVPSDHIRVFQLDLPAGADANNPMAYHGINIRDPRYLSEWKFLFGKAASIQ